ncbi:alkaline phosphatase D family protein [Parvularcula dongshanensis]|uniref:Phosphodiesterase/alkaline phosphatase D-like protein n=1 Tax=Parvularcula dongshanensis TaxID=1173995 RepID=A0A840I0Y4_9PROT|nr:alkaline phosphatase D family protein [Parvularcula dongshanensis]MBB4657858.1 phosphodiesterase/alkaline phosphatase D-like protein [Parvularcula dongshanensis]
MDITRRMALTGGLIGLAACETTGRGRAREESPARFAWGVASGDPAPDSVVLWTRAEPLAGDAARGVVEVAEDEGFEAVVWSAPFEATPATDYTVKVVPTGLKPGGRYHYRFRAGGTQIAGRTRTLPARADRARFAVVSCSNYPFGHFNAYAAIAREEIDAVIHLGDYIYEYGADGYGGKVGERLGRTHAPAKECVTLDEYRVRHRQYKTDAGSWAMHAAMPLIAVWDDHETANNSWEGGAQNHQPDEGDWGARERAALQAYYEYMPVREPDADPEALFRSYEWGGLVTLAAIETRLTARSKQFEYDEVLPELTSPRAIAAWREETLGAEDRRMMGTAQEDFLARTFSRSKERGVPWRLVANQVIMARVTAPDLAPHLTDADITAIETEWDQIRAFVRFTSLGLPLNLDAWDGYPAARARLFERAREAGAADLLVLTGDTHESWANSLHDEDGTPMGTELGVTGVSSPGPTGYLKGRARDYSLLLRQQNPEVRWHATDGNGYIDLILTPEGGEAAYVMVDTLEREDPGTTVRARFALRREGGTVALAEPEGLAEDELALFQA